MALVCVRTHLKTLLLPLPLLPPLSPGRLIIVSNVLPIRAKRNGAVWEFEWDEDALIAQAKASILSTAARSRGSRRETRTPVHLSLIPISEPTRLKPIS